MIASYLATSGVFVLFLFSLRRGSVSFLPGLILPSYSRHSQFSYSTMVFTFTDLSEVRLLTFFLVYSMFAFLASNFVDII